MSRLVAVTSIVLPISVAQLLNTTACRVFMIVRFVKAALLRAGEIEAVAVAAVALVKSADDRDVC